MKAAAAKVLHKKNEKKTQCEGEGKAQVEGPNNQDPRTPSAELKWTQTKGAGGGPHRAFCAKRKQRAERTNQDPQSLRLTFADSTHTLTHTHTHSEEESAGEIGSGGCLQASLHQMSFAFQQNNKMALLRTKGTPKAKGNTQAGMGARITPWPQQQRGQVGARQNVERTAHPKPSSGSSSRRTSSLAQAINVKFFHAAAA